MWILVTWALMVVSHVVVGQVCRDVTISGIDGLTGQGVTVTIKWAGKSQPQASSLYLAVSGSNIFTGEELYLMKVSGLDGCVGEGPCAPTVTANFVFQRKVRLSMLDASMAMTSAGKESVFFFAGGQDDVDRGIFVMENPELYEREHPINQLASLKAARYKSDGTRDIVRIAGVGNDAGFVDGDALTAAKFGSTVRLAARYNTTVYVADLSNNRIRRVNRILSIVDTLSEVQRPGVLTVHQVGDSYVLVVSAQNANGAIALALQTVEPTTGSLALATLQWNGSAFASSFSALNSLNATVKGFENVPPFSSTGAALFAAAPGTCELLGVNMPANGVATIEKITPTHGSNPCGQNSIIAVEEIEGIAVAMYVGNAAGVLPMLRFGDSCAVTQQPTATSTFTPGAPATTETAQPAMGSATAAAPSEEGTPSWLIAAVVIGVVGIIAMVGVAAFIVSRKRSQKRASPASGPDAERSEAPPIVLNENAWRFKENDGDGTGQFSLPFGTADDSAAGRQLTKEQLIEQFEYQKSNLIGRGANGSVYRAVLHDGCHVAMKEILLHSNDEALMTEVTKELDIIRQLRHPNIVEYYASLHDGEHQKLLLFMELVPSGSLLAAVRGSQSVLPEAAAKAYTRQIVEGLAYIHARGAVHRDIKCDNILLTTDGTCKIADFGASRVLADTIGGSTHGATSLVGTPHFMAPELMISTSTSAASDTGSTGSGSSASSTGLSYGKKADIWSLGITVLEMLNRGQPPWPKFLNHGAAFVHIASADNSPIIPDHLSDGCKNFVQRCCCREPGARPAAADLLADPWLI